jgi:hypothetical protein
MFERFRQSHHCSPPVGFELTGYPFSQASASPPVVRQSTSGLPLGTCVAAAGSVVRASKARHQRKKCHWKKCPFLLVSRQSASPPVHIPAGLHWRKKRIWVARNQKGYFQHERY